MFLKRMAAIFVCLMLLLQFTACKNEPTSYSSSTSFQTESGSEFSSNTSSQLGDQDEDRLDYLASISSSQNSNNSQHITSQDKAPLGSSPSNSVQTDGNLQQGTGESPTINCSHEGGDPYQNISKTEFYADYEPACCNLDASYRSQHGLLSGELAIPGQYAQESQNRPMSGGKYIRNTTTKYLDGGNTYVVLSSNGKEIMRIHKAGGYITLEEVAAYMFAFGGSGKIPANYISKKSGRPSTSIWGEYLRVNHSYFIGDTNKYPYEPELPNITGCGGSLNYYEMDIGTTGTPTPGYPSKPYIQNDKINRGAARIVYTRQDLNGNGIYENNEVYVFYTHNHYNDFREYLNYYGGWGKMFGNVTGGGEYSSKTNARPTPYVPTAYKSF